MENYEEDIQIASPIRSDFLKRPPLDYSTESIMKMSNREIIDLAYALQKENTIEPFENKYKDK